MSKQKKFVLSGYFGFKNFGDEAILSVLVNKLSAKGHAITVISSDPNYTKNKYENIDSIYTFDLKSVFFKILKSDYLISGGGSLLQDVTSFKSLVYYLLVIFTALCLRKKVIVFAQGIGPINSKIGRFFTFMLLKHCKYISVRDEKSLDMLLSRGIKAEKVCDPVFSIKTENAEKTEKIAIQLRDFKTLTEKFLQNLAASVAENFPGREIEIYPFQESADIEVCKKFEHIFAKFAPGTKTTVFSELADCEIIKNISKCEYLIAMRFHAVIIGLLTGVKTMAINYDIKVENTANEFNLPLVGMTGEFGNNFELLKNYDITETNRKVSEKIFDWSGFDKAIEDTDWDN